MQTKWTGMMLAGAIAAMGAVAQTQPPAPVNTMCGDCGVVRSVRAITKEAPPPPNDESKPSGLVVSVPLRGGKATIGGSQNIGKDAVAATMTWEVIVRLDDGRIRVMTLEEDPGELREGDKVRIEQGKPMRRN